MNSTSLYDDVAYASWAVVLPEHFGERLGAPWARAYRLPPCSASPPAPQGGRWSTRHQSRGRGSGSRRGHHAVAHAGLTHRDEPPVAASDGGPGVIRCGGADGPGDTVGRGHHPVAHSAFSHCDEQPV